MYQKGEYSILKKKHVISAVTIAATLLMTQPAFADENTTDTRTNQITTLKVQESTTKSKVKAIATKLKEQKDAEKKKQKSSFADFDFGFVTVAGADTFGTTPSVPSFVVDEVVEETTEAELFAAQVESINTTSKRTALENDLKREAEEKARKEAEEKARKEAEEKAAAEKAKKEAEEKAKAEAEAKAKAEAEAAAQAEATTTASVSGVVTPGAVDTAGLVYDYAGAGSYPVGQCTWGTKVLAPWAGPYWGNGGQWGASAAAAGFRTGSTPQVGAIISWNDGGYGHVAYVVAVESETSIQVMEANYNGNQSIGNYRGWFNPLTSGGYVTYIYPN